MIIKCTEKEKRAILRRLSPENCGCIDCPVFESCCQFTTCDEALEKGIIWQIESEARSNG